MSFIVAVAYEQMVVLGPPKETWQELTLGTPVPANVASVILPQFQRWRRYAQPVLSKGGDIVGIRISSRMSPKLARQLRAKVEPFLRQLGEQAAPAAPAEPTNVPRTLSLSKFGLYIPARNAMRARSVLERVADIEVQYDADEEHVVALLIPPGASAAAIFSALKVDAVPIEPSSENHRQHLLQLLHDELKELHDRPLRAR